MAQSSQLVGSGAGASVAERVVAIARALAGLAGAVVVLPRRWLRERAPQRAQGAEPPERGTYD